ncbi:MAG: EpsG family protein [Dorea sp.]
MAIYSLTYVLNALGFFTNKRDSRILKILVLLLLIFISGTRYYMGGSDVLVYEGVYNAVPAPGIILKYIFTGINEGVNTNYESGFLLLCSVIKSLGFSYFGFILIWTIIFYTLVVKGLEDFVPNWAAFFAVFMYKLMFYDTFISIRQGLTIAMFCYMLQYIRDRKWYIYFPLCFLALLEHSGAIILFPVYFIVYVPVSKRFIRSFALAMAPTWFISSRVDLSGMIYSVAEFLGNSKGERWAESTETISLIHTIECYLVIALVLIFYEKIISNKRGKEVKLVLQLLLVAIPMFTLFKDWIVLTREKDYFVMMYGILLGYILDGGTITPLEYDGEGYELYSPCSYAGIKNAKIISCIIIAVCFIGMTRFVMVFDGGVLKHFTSFITEGVSIFQ